MISLDVLKDHLQIDADDSSKDDLLERLEAAAVAFVETQTGRYFGAPKNLDLIVVGTGAPRLWLPETPANTDGIVVTEAQYAGATADTLVAADDNGFIARDASLVRKNGYVWRRGYEYAITLPVGYEERAEPADIRQLVIDIVSLHYNKIGSEGISAETFGTGYSYTRTTDADIIGSIPGAAETIAAYRWPVVV